MKSLKERVPILGEDPGSAGFEEMEGYAIDAYPYTFLFSEDARLIALRTVATHFDLTPEEALEQFEIIIVPGVGFHGKIKARKIPSG